MSPAEVEVLRAELAGGAVVYVRVGHYCPNRHEPGGHYEADRWSRAVRVVRTPDGPKVHTAAGDLCLVSLLKPADVVVGRPLFPPTPEPG
jgi:hypothetical protein